VAKSQLLEVFSQNAELLAEILHSRTGYEYISMLFEELLQAFIDFPV
jgi:hypothetical protein